MSSLDRKIYYAERVARAYYKTWLNCMYCLSGVVSNQSVVMYVPRVESKKHTLSSLINVAEIYFPEFVFKFDHENFTVKHGKGILEIRVPNE